MFNLGSLIMLIVVAIFFLVLGATFSVKIKELVRQATGGRISLTETPPTPTPTSESQPSDSSQN